MENFFDGNAPVDLSNVIYIWGDTETTGLSNEKERMTEIALIKTDSNFNIIDTYETLINPEREITPKITELTGITEEMISESDKYDEAIPKIKEWWTKDTDNKQIIFVAHNCPFDKGFINKATNDILGEEIVNDFIDTVSVARELKPFWRNHKLDTCAKKFGIVNENHHRAMNDTMVLLEIGKILIKEALESNLNPVNFITKKNLHYKK